MNDSILLNCVKIFKLKINPQRTVPFIVDNGHNGVTIIDSHAIAVYLCENYAKDDQLYPKDSVKRAHINAGLHFDTGDCE